MIHTFLNLLQDMEKQSEHFLSDFKTSTPEHVNRANLQRRFMQIFTAGLAFGHEQNRAESIE